MFISIGTAIALTIALGTSLFLMIITTYANYLLDKAPTDTAFINAPASLLAVYLYERGDSASAAITLSNAQPFYSLAALLRRVMTGGMASTMFGEMRKELHHKVVAGIFGEEE